MRLVIESEAKTNGDLWAVVEGVLDDLKRGLMRGSGIIAESDVVYKWNTTHDE